MTETLIERIQRHEGFRSLPYLDTLGFWTVGIGHCLGRSKTFCEPYANGISMEDALALLEQDIEKTKKHAAQEFPWLLGLDDCRADVIVEMCFQLGVGGVAKFQHMIAAIRDKDWDTAVKEMLDSAWHKQTPSRAEELAELMLNGDNS